MDPEFIPTHRIRGKGDGGTSDWVPVRKDDEEPQVYYDVHGNALYAGIWFPNVEIEKMPTPNEVRLREKAYELYSEACGGKPVVGMDEWGWSEENWTQHARDVLAAEEARRSAFTELREIDDEMDRLDEQTQQEARRAWDDAMREILQEPHAEFRDVLLRAATEVYKAGIRKGRDIGAWD